MGLLRRLFDFYRVQAELVWNWRHGRRHLVWRAIVSFFVGAFALGVTAWLLPGVRVDNFYTLTVVVIAIGALSALVRPLLLRIVAPISLVALLIAAPAFQIAVFLALALVVPGYHLSEPYYAVFAAVVFATINSILSWLLSLDSDDSYYSVLVRRLLRRRSDAIPSSKPGFVIIQIDGLSHQVLMQQMQAGRVPIMSRWVNHGLMRLGSWTTLLPSQTSASQAGILFGSNDNIPAFRWYDKTNRQMFVSNRAADAERLERRLVEANHEGLLSKDGASIGNLLSGGAERSYLTLSTMSDPSKGLGHSRSYLAFFLSPYGFSHALVLGVAEAAKEIFQAYRARVAGIEPRLTRGFPYPFLRAVTNVVLRPLCTSLVIEEMLRGTSVIYVTYTDYDEIAHHSGPQRPESLDALDGIDRALGSLARAAEDAPRPYHFVILSDHGQTLGATFLQRYGKTLEELIRQLMGGAASVEAAIGDLEQWRVLNSFLSELSRARGTSTVTRTALRQRERRRQRRLTRAAAQVQQARQEEAPDRPDIIVCASGNLSVVYFPDIDGRADLETLNARFPEMVEALASHPGIGLVLVRSAEHGALVIGQSGVRHLADGKVEGDDPLLGFGAEAAPALKRLDAMDNCGDLALISMFDPDTVQVAAFEELIGSHGGLGGPQTDALMLYPSDWELDAELVGAEAVYTQLRAWMRHAIPENAMIDPDELAAVAA
ncbi:MAG TPA: alkaline phosphatase family protein [Candidatus Limnocylindrales bacterium]